jgi:hypothetical protein
LTVTTRTDKITSEQTTKHHGAQETDMEWRQGTAVAFTTDKNGKPIAYRSSFMCSRLRWVRMNMLDAQLGIATGHYVEAEYISWTTVGRAR